MNRLGRKYILLPNSIDLANWQDKDTQPGNNS